MKLGIQEVYAKAWEHFKTNSIAILVTMFFLPLGLVLAFALSSAIAGSIDARLIPLVALIFAVLLLVLKLGVTGASLEIADGKKFEFNTLFVYVNRFFSYFATMILYGIIVVTGLLLFIIPGLIFMTMFWLAPYLSLEGRGPIDALKESAKLSSGSKWDIFLFMATMNVVVYLGYWAFGVGILIAVPVAMIAAAHVYRTFVRK